MNARVNLLPRELEEQARTRRSTGWTIGAVALWAALLGVLYIAKLADVNEAREERDRTQQQVQTAQAELDSLQRYAELDAQVNERNRLLAAAMATEISWARVLNDLALTFPASSSMLSFVGTAAGAGEAGVDGTGPVNSESVAGATFNGYSVERYAPGVERVLVKFGEVDTFFNAYLTEAAEEERGRTEVTAFNGTFQLNDEAYTGRYAQGLPPEVGQ